MISYQTDYRRAGCLVFLTAVLVVTQTLVFGQAERNSPTALPFGHVRLEDLSFFKSPGKNWQIVGNVFSDRSKEQSLESTPGKGVLANLSDPENRGHLFSKQEHGDIELELEVLMPAGSNSGLYFQGRYEVQLMDSWGKTGLKYSDLGGIYQRTDTLTNQGFEGYAPLVNASKAPGLWQQLRILFSAPRFDVSGKKVANARFEKVYLNGLLIQDGVEVSGPTRSAAFKDERPSGPLMIQGNHGRVAFRNIRYKLYGNQRVTAESILLREFKSPGDTLVKLVKQNPVAELQTDSISYLTATQSEIFLLEYEGRLVFPRAGDYFFKMHSGGGGALVIGKDTVLFQDGVHGFEEGFAGIYKAAAGSAEFRLIYNKPIGWRKGLTLEVEGPGMALHALHAPGSKFQEEKVEAIVLAPKWGQAVLQRSFMEDGTGKRTHCLSVGTLEKINYTVDLETGSLFRIWYGAFLEVTSMWHRRGNQQLGVPLGPVISLPGEVDSWTGGGRRDAVETDALKFVEYRLDAKGLPTFFYTRSGLAIQDKLVPSATQRSLQRQLVFTATTDFCYRIASGNTVELLPDGSYGINGKEYYLVIQTPGVIPVIQKSAAGADLIFQGRGRQELAYSFIW